MAEHCSLVVTMNSQEGRKNEYQCFELLVCQSANKPSLAIANMNISTHAGPNNQKTLKYSPEHDLKQI